MQELYTHYDVTSEGAKRGGNSRSDFKKILYKNETTFSFDRYVKKPKVIFNVLGKYGVPLKED